MGSTPAEWKPGQSLEVHSTIGLSSMAFLLAARFATDTEFTGIESFYVGIRATGLQERTLYVAGGTLLWSAHKCSISESVKELTIECQKLITDYREYAVEVAEDIFWLFGFDLNKALMLEIQAKVVPPNGLWPD